MEDQRLRASLVAKLEGVPRPRVLDLGCGTGLVYGLLSELGADLDYVGIDISAEMIQCARRKFPNGRFIRGTLETLGTAIGSSFDLIVAANLTFSYIDFPGLVLERCSFLLDAQGKIFLSCLRKLSLRTLTGLSGNCVSVAGSRNADLERAPPVWLFSRASLHHLAEHHGLVVESLGARGVLAGMVEAGPLVGLEPILETYLPFCARSWECVMRLKGPAR